MPPRSRLAPLPVPAWIALKRDGGALSPATIRQLIDGIVAGRIPDYQIAALLMAVLFRGLGEDELVTWTQAMIDSGERLSFPKVRGPKIDKHSTGGVGDKLTLPLAPLVAVCGVNAPLLTGRALGHTGGTLDKMESIRGFRGTLTAAAFQRVLGRVGFVIAGQTPRIAPADRILYALRDATATVESIPLIASSILSKKVAGGAEGLVLDVKTGRGAFLPSRARTRALARTLVSLGNRLGLRTVALLTAMDEPLGREVGNALEVKETLALLRGEGPADSRALTLRLGIEMLRVGRVETDEARARAALEGALASGAAYERFLRGVELQGGDIRLLERPERLPRARHQLLVRAPRAGIVDLVDARLVGQAATQLGAGRLKKEDRVDPGVGLTLHAKGGTRVGAGEPLATVWYNDAGRLRAVRPLLEGAFRVGDGTPRLPRLVQERIE